MSKRKSLTGTKLLALHEESGAETEAYWLQSTSVLSARGRGIVVKLSLGDKRQ